MTDRPLAKYENRQLWLDKGLSGYEPVSRAEVNIFYHHFKGLAEDGPFHSPTAAGYADQLRAALDQFTAAMEDAT